MMDKERLKWVIGGIDFDLLTSWEEKFVQSVEFQFKRKGGLTDKQIEILERIYKEKGK